jgi:hypothetical protein
MKAMGEGNCWLYDETDGDAGWPEELNGFPL